jgi:hypothetical protein
MGLVFFLKIMDFNVAPVIIVAMLTNPEVEISLQTTKQLEISTLADIWSTGGILIHATTMIEVPCICSCQQVYAAKDLQALRWI